MTSPPKQSVADIAAIAEGMTPSLADVASALTEAQRRWMTMQGAGAKCTKRLVELGLIKPCGYQIWQITELGAAVRARLQGRNDDG